MPGPFEEDPFFGIANEVLLVKVRLAIDVRTNETQLITQFEKIRIRRRWGRKIMRPPRVLGQRTSVASGSTAGRRLQIEHVEPVESGSHQPPTRRESRDTGPENEHRHLDGLRRLGRKMPVPNPMSGLKRCLVKTAFKRRRGRLTAGPQQTGTG